MTALIDVLYDENERLRTAINQHVKTNHDLWIELGRLRDLTNALTKDNERLKAERDVRAEWAEDSVDALRADNERLRAVVDAVRQMIDLDEIDVNQPESYALVEALARTKRA